MTKIESKAIDFIKNNSLIFMLAAVSVAAVVVRMCGINFESGDYTDFLKEWWSIIDANGIVGLGVQTGNYNIPYQIVIYLMTLLPLGALYSYKLISIIFDFVLAFSTAALVYECTRSKLRAAVAYCAVLLSLEVIFNSAFWAQCDSIYVSFAVLGLLFLYREKPIPAFVFFGVAFAFKLQTIFLLPIMLYCLLLTKKISILHFFIIPAVDAVMCLPAFVMGRPITELITIYAEQTDYGKQIQMNCPNLYALMCSGSETSYYYLLKIFSIFFTAAILGGMLCVFLYKKVSLADKETFLLTAAWTVFTCVMFLSSMHERYFYLLNTLFIVYSAVTAKRIWLPVLSTLISLRGYCFYLFEFEFLSLNYTAVINTALYVYMTIVLIKTAFRKNKQKTRST